MVRWLDRWATRLQRKSDERAARWQERQRERARSGQMTAADRWMARAQRKSDERAARWQELEPLRQLVTAAPIRGPSDSAAVISVDQSGPRWLSPLNPYGLGPAGPVDLLRLLITEAIWLLVFRRSYTVHVRTNDHPPVKIHVRLPSEIAAYHAAARLVSRFHDDGPAALQNWQADETSASSHTASR